MSQAAKPAAGAHPGWARGGGRGGGGEASRRSPERRDTSKVASNRGRVARVLSGAEAACRTNMPLMFTECRHQPECRTLLNRPQARPLHAPPTGAESPSPGLSDALRRHGLHALRGVVVGMLPICLSLAQRHAARVGPSRAGRPTWKPGAEATQGGRTVRRIRTTPIGVGPPSDRLLRGHPSWIRRTFQQSLASDASAPFAGAFLPEPVCTGLLVVQPQADGQSGSPPSDTSHLQTRQAPMAEASSTLSNFK